MLPINNEVVKCIVLLYCSYSISRSGLWSMPCASHLNQGHGETQMDRCSRMPQTVRSAAKSFALAIRPPNAYRLPYTLQEENVHTGWLTATDITLKVLGSQLKACCKQRKKQNLLTSVDYELKSGPCYQTEDMQSGILVYTLQAAPFSILKPHIHCAANWISAQYFPSFIPVPKLKFPTGPYGHVWQLEHFFFPFSDRILKKHKLFCDSRRVSNGFR